MTASISIAAQVVDHAVTVDEALTQVRTLGSGTVCPSIQPLALCTENKNLFRFFLLHPMSVGTGVEGNLISV